MYTCICFDMYLSSYKYISVCYNTHVYMYCVDVPPSDLAQPKVRERLRPPTDIIEWKELAALIEKAWDRVAEVCVCMMM